MCSFVADLLELEKALLRPKLQLPCLWGDVFDEYRNLQYPKNFKPVKTQVISYNQMWKDQWNRDIVASFATEVKKDRRVSVRDLVDAHGVSYGNISNTLQDDLGLVKKLARWGGGGLKLLSDYQKNKQVSISRGHFSLLKSYVSQHPLYGRNHG